MNATPPDEIELTAAWINRLRWFAIVGQIGTIAAAIGLTHVELSMGALGIVLAIEVVFALGCEVLRRRRRLAATGLLLCMIGDVGFSTALLYFTGGPENPFNFLYLVHVTLALVALGERAAWTLLVLSAVAFGGLFFWSQPLQMHGAEDHSAMGLHMQGMWVGLIVAGGFIVSFASRLTRSLRQRELALADARARAQHSERLAALATLAAGAAHELNTPLSTIAVVAKELERNAVDLGDDIVDDARLIRSEIERCRHILEQLSVDAGYATGSEASYMSVGEVLDGCERLSDARAVVEIPPAVRDAEVLVHARPLRLGINAVVANALQAGDRPVTIRVDRADDDLIIEVRDEGAGMPADVESRAFDPFFSVKAGGMGLGLFLARGVAEAVGGEVELDSVVGTGTTVTFRLPLFGAHDER